MPAWTIAINLNPTQPPRAAFSPATLQALGGDLISWANNDNRQAHWPAPVQDGQVDKTGWLSEEIPPNASSRQSFSPLVPPAEATSVTYDYCCALHPDETGTIVVLAAPPTP